MSSASQGITIFPFPKDSDWSSDSDYLILIKKTGYANIWINGKHYYWDERIDKSHIENSALIFAFNGGKSKEKEDKKKGKIIVKKKRKK